MRRNQESNLYAICCLLFFSLRSRLVEKVWWVVVKRASSGLGAPYFSFSELVAKDFFLLYSSSP